MYLEEGPEGFTIERRGCISTGRPKKLTKEVDEDLLTEVQRLRAENEYDSAGKLTLSNQETDSVINGLLQPGDGSTVQTVIGVYLVIPLGDSE